MKTSNETRALRTDIVLGETRVTSYYEPPTCIQYTVFAGAAVMVLGIQLATGEMLRRE